MRAPEKKNSALGKVRVLTRLWKHHNVPGLKKEEEEEEEKEFRLYAVVEVLLYVHRNRRFIRGQVVHHIVQELCESRGGRPGLSVLTSLLFPWT